MKENTTILDCTTHHSPNVTNHIDDQIHLEINDIDDLAIAWISFEDSDKDEMIFYRIEETVNNCAIPLHETQWLWRRGGRHGSGNINITQWLHKHWEEFNLEKHNVFYLAIAMYDFEYKHWLFKGGKWSFNAQLKQNGQTIWHKYDFKKSDGVYGLKYLKIFRFEIGEKILISEIIEENIAQKIKDRTEQECNFIDEASLKDKISSPFSNKSSDKTKGSNSNIFKIFFDTLTSASFIIFSFMIFYYHTFLAKHQLSAFAVVNLWAIIYAFVRFELGGMAWELVLRKKHNNELDTFMVILGLLFTAAFGAITSFEFSGESMRSSSWYMLGVYILYITTNVVLLYILTVVGTYIINTLKANKTIVLVLTIFIGANIMIHEVINYMRFSNGTISNTMIERNTHATQK